MGTNWPGLIGLRTCERDQQAQRVAVASRMLQQRDAACEAARQRLQQALNEARAQGANGVVEVRQLAAQRVHVAQLLEQLEARQREQAAAYQVWNDEQARLVTAEQRLEQLERLWQQQQAAAAAQAARRQQHELEEVWQATRGIHRAA
jgi:hypothetical protein